MLRPWESEEIKRLLQLQEETNSLLRQLVEKKDEVRVVQLPFPEPTEVEFEEVTKQDDGTTARGKKRGK